ncbi:MAG: glycoside hydrolase family 31 protein, partial [bacterium]
MAIPMPNYENWKLNPVTADWLKIHYPHALLLKKNRIFLQEQWRYFPVTRAAKVREHAGGLDIDLELLEGGAGRAKIEVWNERTIRFRFSHGEINDETSLPEPLVSEPKHLTPRVAVAKSNAKLETGEMRCEVEGATFSGRILHRNQPKVKWGAFEGTGVADPITLPLGTCASPDGEDSCFVTLGLEPGEKIYGLGERFNSFNHRGRSFCLMNGDTGCLTTTDQGYKNVPFLLSSEGYGLFVRSGAPIQFDVGDFVLGAMSLCCPGKILDLFFIFGDTPADILKAYTELTGRPPLPPKWTLGTWMSRCMYRSRREVEEIVAKFDEKKIPLNVVSLDPMWQKDRTRSPMDHFRMEWDEEAWPEPAQFVKELQQRGIRICLWENPYVLEHSPEWEEAWPRGFLLKKADGSPAYCEETVYARWKLKGRAAVPIDFTHPEAIAWFKEKHRPRLREGVAVFKADYGEIVPLSAQAWNGMSGTQLRNIYAYFYIRAVAEVTDEITGTPVVWARSGFAGSQRYPTCWGGDSQTNWESLSGTLRAALSMSLSGFPYWSHDVGGFHGQNPPDPELFARWAQFGAMSSNMRFHGTTPREPWMFGAKAEASVKAAIELRYRLAPYLFSVAQEAAATGLPFVRPLLLEFPQSSYAAHCDDQFMLGAALMVAPLLRPGGRRKVYLPKGDWFDFWTGRRTRGPLTFEGRWPLARFPLYVRGGRPLPMQPLVLRLEEKPWAEIEWHIFGTGEFAGQCADVNGTLNVSGAVGRSEAAIEGSGGGRPVSLILHRWKKAAACEASGRIEGPMQKKDKTTTVRLPAAERSWRIVLK